MTGCHGDQDDLVGRFEFADAVDDGHVQYVPALQRFVRDVPQDVFRHFRIMFQLHGQDGFSVMDIPHSAEKRDDGADVMPPGTQAFQFFVHVEVLLPDTDGYKRFLSHDVPASWSSKQPEGIVGRPGVLGQLADGDAVHAGFGDGTDGMAVDTA